MKIFIDTEFTGLTKDTDLISIGMVSENEDKFYAELTDYRKSKVSKWVQEHVIDKLLLNDFDSDDLYEDEGLKMTTIKCDKIRLKVELESWFESIYENMNDNELIEIWGDCVAYDWVLLCEIFGGAEFIPKYINYIPFDLCTYLKIKGLNPDINRRDFIRDDKDIIINDNNHNAIYDAQILKKCFDKLKRM